VFAETLGDWDLEPEEVELKLIKRKPGTTLGVREQLTPKKNFDKEFNGFCGA
jgi:hypothetical protein